MRTCEREGCDNEFKEHKSGGNIKRFCLRGCRKKAGRIRWKKKYPEKVRSYIYKHIKKRYQNDPEFRYHMDLRRSSNMHPKTHAKHIMRILGDDKIETCTIHKR